MSLFRPILLIAALAFGVSACSDNDPPSNPTPRVAGNTGASAVDDDNPDVAPAGDAAALDARLVNLGWAGAAATTHAYAEACGASAAQLDTHLAAQRKQATAMGTAAAEFDRQFEKALPVATRRVEIDDVAMSVGRRAGTCESILASLR